MAIRSMAGGAPVLYLAAGAAIGAAITLLLCPPSRLSATFSSEKGDNGGETGVVKGVPDHVRAEVISFMKMQ